jgi:fatty acid desaturase
MERHMARNKKNKKKINPANQPKSRPVIERMTPELLAIRTAKAKKQFVIALVVSCVLTAGFIALLAISFALSFVSWSVFTLFVAVIVTIVAWSLFYMAHLQYDDCLHPDKRKRYGSGNRKNRRK